MTAKEHRIKAIVRKRGGASKVRTKSLPGGKYRHVYVVRVAGPNGGHTVEGVTETKKGK
jgi:hypothetical protein